MAGMHDLQVVVTKGVEVNNSVQAITSAVNAGRMIELVKQVQEFEKGLKKVKEQDNTEGQKVKEEGSNKNKVIKAEENAQDKEQSKQTFSEKHFQADEYRGSIIDLRI